MNVGSACTHEWNDVFLHFSRRGNVSQEKRKPYLESQRESVMALFHSSEHTEIKATRKEAVCVARVMIDVVDEWMKKLGSRRESEWEYNGIIEIRRKEMLMKR